MSCRMVRGRGLKQFRHLQHYCANLECCVTNGLVPLLVLHSLSCNNIALEIIVANVLCSTNFKVNLFRCHQLSPNNALLRLPNPTQSFPSSSQKILHKFSFLLQDCLGIILCNKRDCLTSQYLFGIIFFHERKGVFEVVYCL